MLDTELETKSMNRILPSRMVTNNSNTIAIASNIIVITNNTLTIALNIIDIRFVAGSLLVEWSTLPTSS